MKRFFALFLAMAMVLGMSMTVFAEPGDVTEETSSTITISGIPDDATVTYQQIAIAAPTSPIGWSLAEGVTLMNGVTLQDLVAVSPAGNDNAEGGKIGADVVDKAIRGMTLSETLTGNVIENVTPGLYAINVELTGYTFNPMLVYVAWNDDNTAAVENTSAAVKGAPNQVNKAIKVESGKDHTSVTENDVVPFEITMKYPYISSALTDRTFTITDTVTGGTLEGEIVITIDDSPVNNVDVAKNEGGFTAEFVYDQTKAGSDVKIEYSVRVSAGTNPLDNKVTASFTTGEDGSTTTTEAEVISPKVNVVVGKIDGSGAALPDATFELYVEVEDGETDATGNAVVPTHAMVNGKIVVAPEGTAATLRKVTEGMTAMNGEVANVTFDGLDAQKRYWVVESQAPNGYSLNDTPYELTGAELEGGVPTEENGILVTRYTVKANFSVNEGSPIVNTTLTALPSTGGIGTTIFTVGGCAIMILAAGMFFVSRRKAAR